VPEGLVAASPDLPWPARLDRDPASVPELAAWLELCLAAVAVPDDDLDRNWPSPCPGPRRLVTLAHDHAQTLGLTIPWPEPTCPDQAACAAELRRLYRLVSRGKRRKRGRPTDTDPKADERICAAWRTGRYKKYADLARELRIKPGEVRNAIDRHRKRPKRQDSKRQ
jgi:hypothetical protein